MKKFLIGILPLLACVFLLQSSPALSQQAVVIPIHGTIEKGVAAFVVRTLESYSTQPGTGLIVVDIDTPGGRVDAALEISDAILSSQKPVVAFVNKQAISAGALIAISSPTIAMTSGATMGDVQPQPTTEKTVSFIRAKMRSLAQKYGRDPRIAEAMVDASIAIPDVIEEGKLLTLTTPEALKYDYAQIESENIPDLLRKLGREDLTVITTEPTIADRIARFITHPIVSSLLLTLGFMGILFELQAPGWGVSGTFGIICILLFFGGHMIAGFAGMESLIVFIIGVVLLALEIFVIPGFGLAGLAGIGSILLSVYLVFGNVLQAAIVVLPALLASTGIILYLLFTLQDSWLAKKFSLNYSMTGLSGFVSAGEAPDIAGKTGIALSPLRPSGRVSIEDQDYTVIAEGRFIERGSTVQVTRTSGSNIYVKKVS